VGHVEHGPRDDDVVVRAQPERDHDRGHSGSFDFNFRLENILECFLS
jgi:hypothetical protein